MAIRIHCTPDDLARVRFAPRPAPLQELNVALLKMCLTDEDLLFGRWRRRLLRSLPTAAAPLADLVPAGSAPLFLDDFTTGLQEGFDALRATPPAFVRSELERVYARHPAPAPPWVRDLHRGDADAWRLLHRAQHAAFETALCPVWPLIQDLHRAEFTRHAVTVAEHGIGGALAQLIPGARLRDGLWQLPSSGPGRDLDIHLHGRGLVLVPTFHWTGRPLLAHLPDLPDRPLHLTYPAGTGLPLSPTPPNGPDDPLAAVLGPTRADILQRLADAHTTTQLARRLGVSNATASAHAAALRGAGLITTVRTGRAVLHRRTPLGSLLVGRGGGGRGAGDAE